RHGRYGGGRRGDRQHGRQHDQSLAHAILSIRTGVQSTAFVASYLPSAFVSTTRRATGTHLSISPCTKRVTSAGLMRFVSTASCASCRRTCGSSKLAATAPFTFSAMSGGRPAGADKAHH